jgi:hypothetical protein
MKRLDRIRRNRERKVHPHAQKVHVVGPHLLDQSLPYELWTDEAEFAAIVHVLVQRPDLDVSTALPLIIREYNASNCIAGVLPRRFHATLMEFKIRAVKYFMDTLPQKTCAASIYTKLLKTALVLPDYVLNFYTARRLVSRRAYLRIVEPDVLPLTRDTLQARLWQHCT